MTTPSGAITANDVNSELGRLVVPFAGADTSGFTDIITISNDYIGYGNRLAEGDAVIYVSNNGTDVSGLTNNATYYVRKAGENQIRLSTTPTGANVNITSIGTGVKYLVRTTNPINLNEERVRRLADKTSGSVSFDDLRNKNVNKTYDTGSVTTSRQMSIPYGDPPVYTEASWGKHANGTYYIYAADRGTGYNPHSLHYYTYDTTAYANASIQSGNLTFTIRVSYYNMDIYDTYMGVIPFIKATNYNTTIEPNYIAAADFANQNDVQYLYTITNTSSSGGYTFGDIVVSYPLQTSVVFGNTGGWSYGSTGYWNTSKLANSLHAVSINLLIGTYGGASNFGEFRVHSCRMNGTYAL